MGVSHARSWSRLLILGAILWAFVAKSRQNLPKLIEGSKGFAWPDVKLEHPILVQMFTSPRTNRILQQSRVDRVG